MIELIKGILIESNFELVNYNINTKPKIENELISEKFDNRSKINYQNYLSFFAKRINNEKFDFFLVIQVSESNLDFIELEMLMKEHLEMILKTQQYPGIDKNMSLLLLTERSVIKYTDEFNKKVYEFEENPFHFKKFLLPFTQEQLDLLDEYLNEQFNSLPVVFNCQDNIIHQLNNLISNKDWFSLFKNRDQGIEEDEAKIFDLVSKIFIKVPYLKVPINKEDLPNLRKEIENEILKDDKEIIEKLLKIKSNDPKWEEILSILGVELDEL